LSLTEVTEDTEADALLRDLRVLCERFLFALDVTRNAPIRSARWFQDVALRS